MGLAPGPPPGAGWRDQLADDTSLRSCGRRAPTVRSLLATGAEEVEAVSQDASSKKFGGEGEVIGKRRVTW